MAYANFRQVLGGKAKPNKYQEIGAKYMEMVYQKYGSPVYKQTGGNPHGWAGFMPVPGHGCAPEVASPNPTNPEKLYVLIHECGHILLAHHKHGFFHRCGEHLRDIDSTLEYEAETFAIEECRKLGIALPDKVVNGAYLYVASHVVCDQAAGHRINSRAMDFARKARTKGGKVVMDEVQAGRLEIFIPGEKKSCTRRPN